MQMTARARNRTARTGLVGVVVAATLVTTMSPANALVSKSGKTVCGVDQKVQIVVWATGTRKGYWPYVTQYQAMTKSLANPIYWDTIHRTANWRVTAEDGYLDDKTTARCVSR